MAETTIQRAVKGAAKLAGVNKPATPHTRTYWRGGRAAW